MNDIVPSSSAEYLTFIAATGGDDDAIELRYEDENIWLTQRLMAELYGVSVQAIGQHLKRLTDDGEIDRAAVIKKYFITGGDGKRYNTNHTAAERIVERADAERPHMGLTSWAAAPGGKIVRSDVSIAKNYPNETERDFLNRIVSMYLDYAELQATRKIPMSMEDWSKHLDGFLEFNGTEILTGPGRISHEQAKLRAETEFEKYRIVRDRLFVSDFDRFLALEEHIDEFTPGGDAEGEA